MQENISKKRNLWMRNKKRKRASSERFLHSSFLRFSLFSQEIEKRLTASWSTTDQSKQRKDMHKESIREIEARKCMMQIDFPPRNRESEYKNSRWEKRFMGILGILSPQTDNSNGSSLMQRNDITLSSHPVMVMTTPGGNSRSLTACLLQSSSCFFCITGIHFHVTTK